MGFLLIGKIKVLTFFRVVLASFLLLVVLRLFNFKVVFSFCISNICKTHFAVSSL